MASLQATCANILDRMNEILDERWVSPTEASAAIEHLASALSLLTDVETSGTLLVFDNDAEDADDADDLEDEDDAEAL